jgi:hypothetical protein
MSYSFESNAKPEAVTEPKKADNPKLPEKSVGDKKTSPVSEAEVTDNGFPSTNDATAPEDDA